jgi:hypothetical protein
MTSNDIEKLSKKYLLSSMPGYIVKGRIIIENNIDLLLRGLAIESSAYDKNRFRIVLFVQPLYILEDHIVFFFRQELGFLTKGHELWWNVDQNIDKNMQEICSLIVKKGQRWLSNIRILQDVILYLNKDKSNIDIHGFRVIAYSYILLGDFQKALKFLNNLIIRIDNSEDNRPWEMEIRDDICNIRDIVIDNPQKAKNLLIDFRRQTLDNLKLTKWAMTDVSHLLG